MVGGSRLGCAGCAEKVGKSDEKIQCNATKKCLYHIECAGINLEEYEKLVTQGKKHLWVCEECRGYENEKASSTVGQTVEKTPVRPNKASKYVKHD